MNSDKQPQQERAEEDAELYKTLKVIFIIHAIVYGLLVFTYYLVRGS